MAGFTCCSFHYFTIVKVFPSNGGETIMKHPPEIGSKSPKIGGFHQPQMVGVWFVVPTLFRIFVAPKKLEMPPLFTAILDHGGTQSNPITHKESALNRLYG